VIRFTCKKCGQKFKVSDQQAGKKGKCPKCKQSLVIPPVEEKSSQESSIIKFRCPSCGQKIGVSGNYAGKRVRCAKCKNPLRVPQAPSQFERPAVEDETRVLRAGQEQRPADEGFWGDLGSMDELLLEEAKAPSVERGMEQKAVDYGAGEREVSAYTGQLPQPDSFAEGGARGAVPKKKRSMIFIVGGCVLGLLLVGVVFWYFLADSGKREMEVKLNEVREFTEEYIGLLEAGEINEAKELLGPRLQSDVQEGEIEKFAELIGKSRMVELECKLTHFEEYPEGNQFFLLYDVRYEEGKQSLVVSVVEVDEEFRIGGIAAQEPFGSTVSIGPRSYKQLSDVVLTATFERFGSIFSRFFCGFMVVVLAVCLLQVVSMWIVFEKASEPGWAILVPGYNMWVLAEVGDKPGWLGLLMFFSGFIPYVGALVGLVLSAVISIGVARAFGRGIGFGVGLTILPFVFYPILAFASD